MAELVRTFRLLGFEQRLAAVGALLLAISTFGPFSFVERATPAEACLGLVPEADLRLPLLPAQVDLAAVPQRREVDQPAIEVAQHDLPVAELEHRFAQLEEPLGHELARLAAAV